MECSKLVRTSSQMLNRIKMLKHIATRKHIIRFELPTLIRYAALKQQFLSKNYSELYITPIG